MYRITIELRPETCVGRYVKRPSFFVRF